MLKRMLLVLSTAAMLTAKPEMPSTDTPENIRYQKTVQESEDAIPKTGEHMSPLIGGMVLAFSGVAIGILIDEKGRK